MLSTLDYSIIGIFLFVTLFIGLYFKNSATQSLGDFFLGGRKLPWYIAGISMVATTFAADTPLWVTEKIKQYGISGNWLWWNMVISGVLTTFFFANLWRRAGVLTELEFVELRYSGAPAKALRAFKSVYLGVFLNCIIIGWVNAAMLKILKIFFDIPDSTAMLVLAGLMLLVAIYSSISGLLGVAFTDAIQFVLAMAGCIILSVILLRSEQVGGISGLKNHFADEPWRLDFFPSIGQAKGVGGYSIPLLSFLSFIGIQWWASWYPGAEPGGGGYVAQRMMSAKDEKNAVLATLFFQIAHYALRPWPWIIIGLCALVLYPDLPMEKSGEGFVLAMRDYLPNGMKGMMLAAFLGAYMSTISTQLNWGASFLTNDLYKRFFKKEETFSDEVEANKHYILIARVMTVLIMLIALFVTTKITMIDQAAQFLIACGAGLGLVLILRWYWWRISAWSEIAATLAPLFFLWISKTFMHDILGEDYTNNNGELVFVVITTTIVWVMVTFLTKPTEKSVLDNFYKQVRPQGNWSAVTIAETENKTSTIGALFVCWVSATVLIYSVLFFIGKLVFLEYSVAAIWFVVGGISALVLGLGMKKADLFS